jgi:protein-S-isoprenylcysteine O-methyltransferase Ste14
MNRALWTRVVTQFLLFPIVMGLLVFLPAGSLHYPEAWICIAVFLACSLIVTLYLAIKDPKLLERRMRAGPAAEKEPVQKIIVGLIFFAFGAEFMLSALDHRFGRSAVPFPVALLGDTLIIVSYLMFLAVFRENTYSAATIRVEEGQRVISSGPYRIVRHPMYAAAIPLVVGIPLALGSYWGLAILFIGIPTLVWRIVEEEKVLRNQLSGYPDYTQKVRFRLLPNIW